MGGITFLILKAILAEKEPSRKPVKITRYTKTANLTKLVVNDIMQITLPNSFECPLQFSQELTQQELTTVEKLHEGPEDNIMMVCKVLKLGETKVVGQAKYHVLDATLADATVSGCFAYGLFAYILYVKHNNKSRYILSSMSRKTTC